MTTFDFNNHNRLTLRPREHPNASLQIKIKSETTTPLNISTQTTRRPLEAQRAQRHQPIQAHTLSVCVNQWTSHSIIGHEVTTKRIQKQSLPIRGTFEEKQTIQSKHSLSISLSLNKHAVSLDAQITLDIGSMDNKQTNTLPQKVTFHSSQNRAKSKGEWKLLN